MSWFLDRWCDKHSCTLVISTGPIDLVSEENCDYSARVCLRGRRPRLQYTCHCHFDLKRSALHPGVNSPNVVVIRSLQALFWFRNTCKTQRDANNKEIGKISSLYSCV